MILGRLFLRAISDLNGDMTLKGIPTTELRKKNPILIIDDDEFPYLQTLKKHEYDITQKKDITDFRDAEAYSIILCDIRGVGSFLESEFAGAYLIKQLKEKYPEKTIIAYTANNYDAKFQQFINYADEVVSKGDCALEDWTSILDRQLEQLSDPKKMWDKTRKKLVDAGVTTYEIAKYESEYVKAIKKGSFESFKKLYESKTDRGSEIMAALGKTLSTVLGFIAG